MFGQSSTTATTTTATVPALSSPLYFLPLGPRVLLRRLDQDTAASLTSTSATFSGFVVPETAKEKVTLCEVVAIPSSPYRTEFGTTLTCPVREGDTVLIGKYTGSEHKVRNAEGKEEELLYVRWEELLGVKRKVQMAHFSEVGTWPEGVVYDGQDTNAQMGYYVSIDRAVPGEDRTEVTSPLPSSADLDATAAEQSVQTYTLTGYTCAPSALRPIVGFEGEPTSTTPDAVTVGCSECGGFLSHTPSCSVGIRQLARKSSQGKDSSL